jgi:hypothetical protein
MIDLERLHKIAKETISPRGAGRTFTNCHNACGAISLGHKNIYALLSSMYDKCITQDMLLGIFPEYDIKVYKIGYDSIYGSNCDGNRFRLKFVLFYDKLYRGMALRDEDCMVDLTRSGRFFNEKI